MIKYIDEDIKEVMEITGLDKTKAEKLFKSVAKDIDDGTDDEICSYDVIDIIKIEHKAKENGADRHYVSGNKPKEKKPREKKIDTEKAKIIEIIAKALKASGYDATITNVDKAIDFGCYTVNLVKHRPPKQ